MTYFFLLLATALEKSRSTQSCPPPQQQQSLDLPLDKLARKTYLSKNSRATLIDSVAYLLAYGKTFKNTACACYSSAAINRADTVWNIILNPKCFIILSYLATARSGNVGSVVPWLMVTNLSLDCGCVKSEPGGSRHPPP